MDINVNVNCDALVGAIDRLCEMVTTARLNQAFEETKSSSTNKGTQSGEAIKEKTVIVGDEKIEDEEIDDEVIEESEESDITLETVRAALAKLAKAKGKEAAKGILEMFDVSKLTDVPKNKYSELIQAIEEA